MGTKTPTVWEDLRDGTATLEGGRPLHLHLDLDTPAWFSWLEDTTTHSFAYPIYNAGQGYIEAFMTLRKERRQRGGAYWTAYSHVGGRLRKAYVGRSPALTQARLHTLAATFLARILAEAPPPAAHPPATGRVRSATMDPREETDDGTRIPPCC
jgi:hypothetical protein